jgi:hypothetical protein
MYYQVEVLTGMEGFWKVWKEAAKDRPFLCWTLSHEQHYRQKPRRLVNRFRTASRDIPSQTHLI